MGTLVRDKTYKNRSLSHKNKFYHFRDFVCEVPDGVAVELVQTGQFDIVDVGVTHNNNYFPFNGDSWKKERKLFYDGAIAPANGYGKAGIMLVDGLSEHADVYVLANGYIKGDASAYQNPDTLNGRLRSLVEKKSDKIDSYYMIFFPGFEMGRKMAERQIAYTMLEATRIPQSWVDNINRNCERVIVPCLAQKDAFINSGVKKDVKVIPLPIIADAYPFVKRKEQEDFIFGVEGTLTYRKGTDITIKAFRQAFPKNQYPNVSLLVKTREGHGMPFGETKKVEGGRIVLDDDERIVVVAEHWSEQRMIEDFYHSIDCYVFLSRGEGWGLTTVQAMSTGLPVIMSDCSGLQDQHGDNRSYQVETKLVDVPPPDEGGYSKDLYAPGQQWWEPNLDSAIAQMRHVYEHRREAAKKGASASRFVRLNYDHKKIGGRIVKYLDDKF